MRTRPPRPGTIVADIADFLGGRQRASVEEIFDAICEVRRRRGLPQVKRASVRGALNSNKGDLGHGLFRSEGRGLYALREARRSGR